MQTITVQSAQNVFIKYPLASVGERILAYILDAIILIASLIAIIGLFMLIEVDAIWTWVIFLMGPLLFYHLLFEIFMDGQSPGKRVMKIQVVSLDGARPSKASYIVRWAFGLIEFFVFMGLLAVIGIAASGKGQRIGDMVAGTTVVKLLGTQQIPAHETFTTPEQKYVPTFPQVVHLESRDIELIQRALDALTEFENGQPVILVTEKFKSMLGIQTELTPVQFLNLVVKDFNHFSAR